MQPALVDWRQIFSSPADERRDGGVIPMRRHAGQRPHGGANDLGSINSKTVRVIQAFAGWRIASTKTSRAARISVRSVALWVAISVPNIGVHTVHDAVVDDFHIPYEFRLVTVGGD